MRIAPTFGRKRIACANASLPRRLRRRAESCPPGGSGPDDLHDTTAPRPNHEGSVDSALRKNSNWRPGSNTNAAGCLSAAWPTPAATPRALARRTKPSLPTTTHPHTPTRYRKGGAWVKTLAARGALPPSRRLPQQRSGRRAPRPTGTPRPDPPPTTPRLRPRCCCRRRRPQPPPRGGRGAGAARCRGGAGRPTRRGRGS
jgi:hypothetical protein